MIFSSSILFSASFPVSPIYYGFYGKNYRNMQSFSKKGYHIFGAASLSVSPSMKESL